MKNDISKLYLKDTYLNKNINILLNKVIIEYDLKSANTSLCKEYKLLPSDKIEEIELLDKKDRVVAIGKMMRKDSKFKEGLKNAFVDIRKRFFIDNRIQDDDILSIKKDAIFCLREVPYTKFGKCNFIKKNIYTSYMYLNKLEFYYNKRGKDFFTPKLDIKGISDIVIEKHENYMLEFIRNLFDHMENDTNNSSLLYFKRFIDKYKMMKLEPEYYREFNNECFIRVNDSDELYDDPIFIQYKDKICIDYNFSNILIPLIDILL